jgi:Fe2+ transport system protein FeoA
LYETVSLSHLPEGESGYVTDVSARPAMERHLADLGLARGARVTSVAGAPGVYLVRGTPVILCRTDADGIRLERELVHEPHIGAATG